MEAVLYSFSKATSVKSKIDRKTYNKNKEFEKGLLIFCNKFDKRNGDYVLTDYKITDKFNIHGISII